MTRVVKKISINKPNHLGDQLLVWAKEYFTFAWLDSNNYPQDYSTFDKVLAVGVKSELMTDSKNAFSKLDRYQQHIKDYIFGYLTYDLKNDTENLSSKNSDHLAFPDLYFFQPLKIFFIKNGFLELHYDMSCAQDIEKDLDVILNTEIPYKKNNQAIRIHQRIDKQEYFNKLTQIQKHITKGDVYELNFCMEFYATATLDPLDTFRALNTISEPPFATYFRHNEHYILSASPERFVRKQGDTIISQPIKGTIKRGKTEQEDRLLQITLSKDPKERAENIMITDLVRNDLSKTATKNSVQVTELCKVYSFKQVHQLISTITSTLTKGVTPVSLLKSLYPMGSMTGAPKISAMKIIEKQECIKRGVYSGTVGYFTPDDNFDFNVVIRSILYNEHNKYVSFSVGGAITSQSKCHKEYQECLLKAEAMKKVLE